MFDEFDAGFQADLRDGSLSIREVARRHGCSFGFVQGRRKRLFGSGVVPVSGSSSSSSSSSQGVVPSEMVLSSDVAWGLDDWRGWLESKGTDPDSVVFSWGVTSNPAGGFWNKLGNVRLKPEVERVGSFFSDADVERFVEGLNSFRLPKRTVSSDGVPVAAVLNLADMQLFKPEGGGVEATLERLGRALAAFRDHVFEVRARGVNLNEIVLVNNGDPFEGVAGNYANQLHVVEGGLRAQMNMVLEVWLLFVRELFPLFERRQFVSVLCNHTQFGRQGGAKQSLTGDEDNGGAFLAEVLQRILHASEDFGDVVFSIPYDEFNVFVDVAGVPVGFNHGHQIPKQDARGFEDWLNGQVRLDSRAYEARLWVTAHRHNLQFFDLGSAFVLQCPSCDGGSKWLSDRSGSHSNSGVVSILVGEHHRLGWSDLMFL